MLRTVILLRGMPQRMVRQKSSFRGHRKVSKAYRIDSTQKQNAHVYKYGFTAFSLEHCVE